MKIWWLVGMLGCLMSYASPTPAKIEAQTFRVGKTWGYDILIEGKTYVHQASIPAVSGNQGFKTEADARKTAQLVIKKIRQNQMPPSVSLEELRQLGVLK